MCTTPARLGRIPTCYVANRAAARARLPESRFARGRTGHQRPYARISRSLPGRIRAQCHGGRRDSAWRHRRPRRATSSSLICRKPCQGRPKGKSMNSEVFGLNAALFSAGMVVVETDLGEYLVQIGVKSQATHRAAIHLNETDTGRFSAPAPPSTRGPRTRRSGAARGEAREVLREKFLAATLASRARTS